MKTFKRLVPAAILLVAVTAIAQPDTTPPPTPAGSAPAPTTPSVQFTASEIRGRAEVVLAQIQEDNKYVLGLRERVRKKKDVIKLDCVNDRLVQLKAQMNIADKANQALQESIEKDLVAANEAFRQLAVTGNAVRELREQANQCIGEPDLFKQEAGLEVTRPDLVDDPGTLNPYEPEGAQVEAPGYASAFN